MMANVWDEDKIADRLYQIAKKFLEGFCLSEYSEPLLWARREKFFCGIKESFFLPDLELIFPVFYKIGVFGLKALLAKDKEGNYINFSNGMMDAEPRYNDREKILEVDNQPVLVFDVDEVSLPKLTVLGQKRELSQKLRAFIFNMFKDRNIGRGLFLIGSSEDLFSFESPSGNFSFKLLYPEGVGFNKNIFLLSKEKTIVTVKEPITNKDAGL
jgi:hypothetical protein